MEVFFCYFLDSTDDLISLIDSYTCVILNNRRMKCWGRNLSGTLGQGHSNRIGDGPNELGDYLPPISLGVGVEIKECFDFAPSFSPTISPSIYIFPQKSCKSDMLGSSSTCIITKSQSLKCWGRNNEGQLGHGDSEDKGDQTGEMGENLTLTSLPGTPISIMASHTSNCVQFDDLQVSCWGYGNYGQLAAGNSFSQGDDPMEMGNYLAHINLGTNLLIRHLAGDYLTHCLISDLNQLKCWGYNNSGQLGQESTDIFGDDPQEVGDYLPNIDLGTNELVNQVNLGNWHTCVLLLSGNIKCFGLSSSGQLGQGSVTTVGDSVNEMGDNLDITPLGSGLVISYLYSGGSSNCVSFSDGSMKCWGLNSFGKLGLEVAS